MVSLMDFDQENDREKEFKLYKFLLNKYSEIINKSETKTIGEIKALIDSNDLTIQSILEEIRPIDFEFEKHYFECAKKAFEYLCNEIDFVETNIDINFWLTPKEVRELKTSDDEDFAVFLCTLLSALGDEKAFVVISQMDNLTTHAFVITEIEGKFILLDPSQKHSFEEFAGKKIEVMQNYSFKGAKIKKFLYKFNNKEYEQFLTTDETSIDEKL
ncbi:MAG: transglutaminase-like domain-containing protein [archaeon]|nr:transglutaminase-like domain-containing protein [archaeon]